MVTRIDVTIPDDSLGGASMAEKQDFADFVAAGLEVLYPGVVGTVNVGPALSTRVYLYGAAVGEERDLADLIGGPWFDEWCQGVAL